MKAKNDGDGQRREPVAAMTVTLFVTGDGARSQRARGNLREALDILDGDRPDVEEVDLLAEPQKGLAQGIFATPALMRRTPDGRQQVLYGDLSDQNRVFDFIGARIPPAG